MFGNFTNNIWIFAVFKSNTGKMFFQPVSKTSGYLAMRFGISIHKVWVWHSIIKKLSKSLIDRKCSSLRIIFNSPQLSLVFFKLWAWSRNSSATLVKALISRFLLFSDQVYFVSCESQNSSLSGERFKWCKFQILLIPFVLVVSLFYMWITSSKKESARLQCCKNVASSYSSKKFPRIANRFCFPLNYC